MCQNNLFENLLKNLLNTLLKSLLKRLHCEPTAFPVNPVLYTKEEGTEEEEELNSWMGVK